MSLNKNFKIYLKTIITLLLILAFLFYINIKIIGDMDVNSYYYYSEISSFDIIFKNIIFLLFNLIALYISDGLLSIVVVLYNIEIFVYNVIEIHFRLCMNYNEIFKIFIIHGAFEFLVLTIIFELSITNFKKLKNDIQKKEESLFINREIVIYKIIVCIILIIVGGFLEANVSHNLILNYVNKNNISIIRGSL